MFLFTPNTCSTTKVCTGISSLPPPTWTSVRSRQRGRGLLASRCEWTGAWWPGWTGRPDSARTARTCAPCSRGFRPSTDPATPTTVHMRHGSQARPVSLDPPGPGPPVTARSFAVLHNPRLPSSGWLAEDPDCFTSILAYANRNGILARFVASFPLVYYFQRCLLFEVQWSLRDAVNFQSCVMDMR